MAVRAGDGSLDAVGASIQRRNFCRVPATRRRLHVLLSRFATPFNSFTIDPDHLGVRCFARVSLVLNSIGVWKVYRTGCTSRRLFANKQTNELSFSELCNESRMHSIRITLLRLFLSLSVFNFLSFFVFIFLFFFLPFCFICFSFFKGKRKFSAGSITCSMVHNNRGTTEGYSVDQWRTLTRTCARLAIHRSST